MQLENVVVEVKLLIDEPRPYYSALDEDYFYRWLDDVDAVVSFSGQGAKLCLSVATPIDDVSLRDLFSLLMRYGVDMRPLVALATESNKGWLEDPKMYWHQNMFG